MNVEMLRGWEGRQMFWGDLSARAGREPVYASCDRWWWGFQTERWHAESLQGRVMRCPKQGGGLLREPGSCIQEWTGWKTAKHPRVLTAGDTTLLPPVRAGGGTLGELGNGAEVTRAKLVTGIHGRRTW